MSEWSCKENFVYFSGFYFSAKGQFERKSQTPRVKRHNTFERHLAGINFMTFVESFVAFVLKDFNTKITKECTKVTDIKCKVHDVVRYIPYSINRQKQVLPKLRNYVILSHAIHLAFSTG
ncbi:MAG: hypothetical protein FWH27_19435 [Planctomycetaceae bacterium]|nr:hypothetical protein [Planctomycetaceae bacterium]